MNKKRITTLIIAVAVIAFILGLGGSLVLNNYLFEAKLKELDNNSGINNNLEIDKILVNDKGYAQAVERVYHSTVMIETSTRGSISGSGSGFIYKTDDNNAYVMTNYHVVVDATTLRVTLVSGEIAEGQFLGGDEYLDIAVLRIDKKYAKQVAPLGKSSDLKRGDNIFAIGSPVGGEYLNSVTSGIVSGIDRKLTVSVNSREDWIMEAIQVDAAINPGNSGGPLLNSSGEVVGINSMKLVDSTIEGMGFAIKIEDALAHVETFEKKETLQRPFLGITVSRIDNAVELSRYGITIDSEITKGIVVMAIQKDSGASKSDLTKGDVITAIEAQQIESPAYLKYVLYKYSPGDKIEVTYIRDGKTKTTEVTLTKTE